MQVLPNPLENFVKYLENALKILERLEKNQGIELSGNPELADQLELADHKKRGDWFITNVSRSPVYLKFE